jgi:hypothetical protein
LKKYNIVKVTDSLETLSSFIRKDYFKGHRPLISSAISGIVRYGYSGDTGVKRIGITIAFLLVCFKVVAPESNFLNVAAYQGIKPFTVLLNAVAMVETKGNNLAYNELENAVGKLQIRQVRLDEYNRLTGNNFTLKDMFNPVNSERVFLYFASVSGPYHFEKIAKRWNGSGPKTELYWQRIKRHL